ncbi:N-formylglutamate amidohydrolase [Primorskyibacter sp. S187A]|uniref:N-formylglutamate amidohydrolase n=1 Tax=Primorskyibacter sp. S187A TaxID=3415130 RepID=UPI003C7B9D1D
MPKIAYHVDLPDRWTSPAVFASPHSGRDYPWNFLRRTVLDQHSIRTSEDAYVDRLFDAAPSFGAPFIRAGAPRAYVDLNRSRDEFDPALIEGVRKQGHNPRVASGLGVIPRVVANGRAIYRGKLSKAEALARIEDIWVPYHDQLQLLLEGAKARFGQAILIDCHSMPHEAVESIARAGARRPEIVLGDRFGASATGDLMDRIESAFTGAGLTVVRNSPFAGAYICQAYGRPSRRQQAIQIEIDRAIYMNEQAIRPNSNFQAFRKLLRGVISDITSIGSQTLPLAAE